ncbi:MAG TPA: glycosyltransferase family 2 protein [Thermoanaerobaculia bacterium]|nr:glycosyltransferase family 2 protein [Thermoanaerobaculia bacterium]
MERIRDLVSVIIPVYNRRELLAEAVASALGQNWPLEIIIIDDGSDEETARFIDELAAERPEIRVVHQQNRGPGSARESGRRIARGEFVQYLDSDDILLPGKLEKQIGGLRRNEAAGVSYGWTRFRHRDGRLGPGPWKESGIVREAMFPSFLRSRWWDTPNPLYRAEVCDRAGAWTDLRVEEDWEYDCRIAALGTRLDHVAGWLVEVRDQRDPAIEENASADAHRLAHRARAHEMILGHALASGIELESEEMRHFARELFLLGRQCGAAGLSGASRRLVHLARSASAQRANDIRIYSAVARIAGWRNVGRVSAAYDRIRDWWRRSA